MVHSARMIAKNPAQIAKLDRVFDTIEERASHLAAFLEGYARFARLPKPRSERVPWAPFLDGIRMLYPDLNVGEAPSQDGYFDAGQIQQVLDQLAQERLRGQRRTLERRARRARGHFLSGRRRRSHADRGRIEARA